MDFVSGVRERAVLDIRDIRSEGYDGKTAHMSGAVHTIRQMGEISFIVLRRTERLVQCVYERRKSGFDIRELKEENTVKVTRTVHGEEGASQGFEIRLQGIRVLSKPAQPMSVAISEWRLNASLETKLALCPISLRNIREQAKFKIQERIVRGFRGYLLNRGFMGIHTPEIVARGAEGGPNMLRLDYFNKKAKLGQSPQFYKQTMVRIYDRVFETTPMFRAEKHNTTRHLNGYTSLGFEIGYIGGSEDVMEMETDVLQYVMALLEQDYEKGLDLLRVTLPDVSRIPAVHFDEAEWLVFRAYSRKIRNPYDLEPKEELLIGRYFKEKSDSDFMFVTHYLSKERPFYAMDDPQDPKFTLSFDLLLHELEMTTGGQRIHDYDRIIGKVTRRGMGPQDIQSYPIVFKCRMPPHGGLGTGLERLTVRLLDRQNIRETCMFPRDVTRLEPWDTGEIYPEGDMIGIREEYCYGKHCKR